MEQSYAEANVKKKTGIGTIAIKPLWIAVIVIMFVLTPVFRYALIIAVAAAAFLIWYWPRFKKEWEYVFCDGQLDFDIISGGEKRKHIMRIEIESADVVAPVGASALDGYRHLSVLDYSSQKPTENRYGIAIRLPKQEEKVMILFEPDERMVQLMRTKCPNIVKS